MQISCIQYYGSIGSIPGHCGSLVTKLLVCQTVLWDGVMQYCLHMGCSCHRDAYPWGRMTSCYWWQRGLWYALLTDRLLLVAVEFVEHFALGGDLALVLPVVEHLLASNLL